MKLNRNIFKRDKKLQKASAPKHAGDTSSSLDLPKEKEDKINKEQNLKEDVRKTTAINTVKEVDPEETFAYPGQKSKKSKIKKRKAPKKAFFKSKKSRNIFIAALIACILAVASACAAFGFSILSTSFEDEDSLKAKSELTPTTNLEDPFYMILVGTDTRESGSGSYSLEDGRSDSCMLVRVDPKSYIVTMISIPRDSMIHRNGQTEKFNAAYAEGGIAATIAEAKKICHVDIAHYAEVSFHGMVDMIDAVGGVEVDVPEAINDPEAGPEPVPQGKNTLNGNQALAFARSRHFFADSDFSRTADQRILLEALIQKAYHMPMSDIPNLLRAAKNFIKTDLKLMDMISVAAHFKDADKLTIYQGMLPSTTATINGASYVILYEDGVDRMMKMVENGEDPSLIEVPDGVATGSSRNSEDVKRRQAEYYKDHPNSPGKMPANSPPVNTPSSGYKDQSYNSGSGSGSGSSGSYSY